MFNFEAQLEQAKNVLEKDTDVLLAYLFGSYAAGTEKVTSDIDIAILLRKEQPEFFAKKEKALFVALIAALKTSKLDIIILNMAPTLLKYRVIKNGKVLVSKDELKRVNYETRIMLRYFDLKPHIERYDRELHKRIKSRAT